MGKLSVFFGFLFRIGTLLIFVLHFILTLFYVMPLNPIKMQHHLLLEGTIGTYFPQNWSLFAPNPAHTDEALLARCLTPIEASRANVKGLPVTGWSNLSNPFWDRFQRNRFSAYDRLIRPQTNTIRKYLAGSSDLRFWLEACQKGAEEACKTYEARFKVAREEATLLLTKIGSSFCQEMEPSLYSHVALRVRETPAIPWSERKTGEKKSKDYDLGTYPINFSVTPLGLYKGASK